MIVTLLERVTEAVVIAEFLRVEATSPRFGPRIRARLEADGRPLQVLTEADTSNAEDNAYRIALLHGYRGVGGSAPLLEGLPEAIEWHRAALPREGLGDIRFIDYPYWNALSDGTRSPAVAAQRIREGIMAMDRPNDGFLALSARICAGEDVGMPMLIAADRDSPLIVLEGHTRITAMALRPDCLPDRIDVFVGFAPEVRGWMYYGTPEGTT